ncbi:hypothetical protein BDP81DRAFT_118809 [Colletotrichum phormii]|uniref:Uncharacterized protein n=1 Tax=Colletotrichum phormii TaxID=359342 RepID=A0AAI9ZFC9_9PEZI|nr:uncharacterized protein BDP81DRAFT_118809 [Colletotrichum phormii]KAK1623524.1 hypothetical protein BDP81DRAFT_118809 [Colletotrichum phormii]
MLTHSGSFFQNILFIFLFLLFFTSPMIPLGHPTRRLLLLDGRGGKHGSVSQTTCHPKTRYTSNWKREALWPHPFIHQATPRHAILTYNSTFASKKQKSVRVKSRPLPVGSRFSASTHPHRKQGACMHAHHDGIRSRDFPCHAVLCHAVPMASIQAKPVAFSTHTLPCPKPHNARCVPTLQPHPPPCRMRNKVTTAQTAPPPCKSTSLSLKFLSGMVPQRWEFE